MTSKQRIEDIIVCAKLKSAVEEWNDKERERIEEYFAKAEEDHYVHENQRSAVVIESAVIEESKDFLKEHS